MSFFQSLFGKLRRTGEDDSDIGEHLSYLNSLRKGGVALSKSDVAVFSRIGGMPLLPEDLVWPEWKGAPLSFLCQLDLSELPEGCERNGLPALGVLYFFYNQEQETWGFEPEDIGSWQVIYTDKAKNQLSQRAIPEGLDKGCIYREKPVAFKAVETYPDWQDERVESLDLNDKQGDQYIDLCTSVFEDDSMHHLFGYPQPVQGNDMELECQLASNGLNCGDSSGYNDPRAKQLEAAKSDWILLFQLDTDDGAGMMWGDCGMLYFWIKKSDLKEKLFENCWMILQCA